MKNFLSLLTLAFLAFIPNAMAQGSSAAPVQLGFLSSATTGSAGCGTLGLGLPPCFVPYSSANPMAITTSGGGGGGGSTAISALTSGTATNSIDSTLFAQTWNWSTLTTQTALNLTATALTTGTVLNLSAPNATTGQALTLSPALGVASGGSGYNFPKFLSALTSTMNTTTGGSNTTVCTIGESTVFGNGSTGSVATAGQNYPPLSFPSQLANLFQQASGINSTWQASMGFGFSNPNFSQSDARFVVGSSWNSYGSTISIGLNALQATTSTNSLTITPTVNTDTFQLYYISGSGNGTVTASATGGSPVTINEALPSPAQLASFTVTGTLGGDTVTLTEASGTVNLQGFKAWDSSKSWVIFVNAGASGSTAAQWTTTSANLYSPGNAAAYQALGCNMIITDISGNDMNANTGLSAFTTNMTNLLAAQKSVSDLVVMTHEPSNPSGGGSSIATQTSYQNVLRNIVASSGYKLVDQYNRWQSYAITSLLGLYADTFNHPNASGYADKANTITSVITPPDQTSFPIGGAPVLPLVLSLASPNNGSISNLVLENQTSTGITQIDFLGGHEYTLGVGNSAQATWANQFLLYDRTNSNAVITINSSDKVGIGTGAGCNANDQLSVCGTMGTTSYFHQNGAAAANTNGYLETAATASASTTNLSPGILLFGGQNATNFHGADLGYNATSARFRTRIITHAAADISFATIPDNTQATGQSSFTDQVTIRGDTGNTGIGTPSPLDKLDVAGGLGFTTTTATVPVNGAYLSTANTLNFTTSGTTQLSISNTGNATFSGHVGLGSPAPTISACGSGTLVSGSSDNKGQITGISAATACTITFSSALPTAPACSFTTSTGIAAGGIPSTTSVTTTMALFTGTLGYICF